MSQPNKIIIIEDNPAMRLGMSESLRREGYQISEYENPQEALEFFSAQPVALVITDLKMEPLDGIAVLKKIKEIHPPTEVLMVSAYGTVEAAVKAMQLGAIDFLTKPFSPEELRVRVNKVWEKIHRQQELDQLLAEKQLLQAELFDDIIGNSKPMRQLFELVRRIAPEDSTVLIEGESGTGKELIARAIHKQSPRAGKPFIKINCGALNENLLESELFGHEKGSFTGAYKRKKGRFELASGGTLFLDEVGDISPAMQVKLLRVLQEQQLERVGGEETISVDVRIICATHRNLSKMVMEEKFREDLFYRLSVIPIKLPPLRERKEDVPALVEHFLNKRKTAQTSKKITPEGIRLLMQYSWPGNIRELENLIERLQVISAGDTIEPDLIAAQLGGSDFHINTNFDNLPLEEAVNTFERNLIIHALKKADGIKNRAARLLGIRTSTLYYKLEKHRLG